MIICGCVARGAALLFVVFGMGMATPCQDSNAASELNGRLKIQETKLYGEAHPYIEEPLPKLKKIVPELKALQPAANQEPEPLPSLLSKIGVKADELLQKIPDLISDEVVVQSEITKGDAAAAGCAGCMLGDTAKRSEGHFNYIIIRHPGRDQRKIFEEYRSGRNGKPISPEVAPVRFPGFAAPFGGRHERFPYIARSTLSAFFCSQRACLGPRKVE